MTQDRLTEARRWLQPKEARAASLAVVGDLALDRYVFGSVERISPEAPVPVLLAERFEDRPGCTANVCANLAALGGAFRIRQTLFGLVGQDEAAGRLKTVLKTAAPDLVSHFLVDESRPTTLKTRYLAGNQHQMLRVDHEKSDAIPKALQERFFEEIQTSYSANRHMIVQDYAKGLLAGGVLPRLLEEARRKNIFTIVDPNRNTPPEDYLQASLITPNVAEAERLLDGRFSLNKGRDHAAVEKACTELKKRLQLRMCLVTRSGHGMTLLDESDHFHHFPAIARSVYDVSGAGDTVVAVLGAALACGASAPVACLLATAAASVVVGKVGTATATAEEILRELEILQKTLS